jgi:hypothetical protein
VEKPQNIGHELKRGRTDALGLPVNIDTAARPVFGDEGRKPFFQERAIEGRVVGNHVHGLTHQIVDSGIINAVTGHHLVRVAGQVRNFGWNRKSGVFEPLPGAEHLVYPPVMPAVLERANAQLDDLISIRIGASRLDIDDGGDELRGVVRSVVFGLWFPGGGGYGRRRFSILSIRSSRICRAQLVNSSAIAVDGPCLHLQTRCVQHGDAGGHAIAILRNRSPTPSRLIATEFLRVKNVPCYQPRTLAILSEFGYHPITILF